MKNLHAISRLLAAAEAAKDPLDRLACRRAAAWLRWCDGYGATLSQSEADRVAVGGALGEFARGLLRRLAESYPAPIEDVRLSYLDEDDGGATLPIEFAAEVDPASFPVPGPRKKVAELVACGAKVDNPFAAPESCFPFGRDLPEPTP
jgi:hypothetical protein